MSQSVPHGCVEQTFAGVDVELRGWRCAAATERRGTIIYLHGIADNRGSATGVVERFVRSGFDVIAYDSRAHGASTGHLCTYGVFEKQDLRRVLDQAGVTDAVLIGHSLGAAVALQAAAGEPRVRAVVAASTFADLRSIAIERAPSFFSNAIDRGRLRSHGARRRLFDRCGEPVIRRRSHFRAGACDSRSLRHQHTFHPFAARLRCIDRTEAPDDGARRRPQ